MEPDEAGIMGRLKGMGKMKKGQENYVGKMTVGEHGVSYLKLENSLFIHFASGKADDILSFFFHTVVYSTEGCHTNFDHLSSSVGNQDWVQWVCLDPLFHTPLPSYV